MGWTTGRSGFDPRQRQRIFLYPLCSDRLWGPPSLLYNGYRGPFPGGKTRPGRDDDHSPHLVPMLWMSRSYTSSPPKRLHGVYWDCFTFYECWQNLMCSLAWSIATRRIAHTRDDEPMTREDPFSDTQIRQNFVRIECGCYNKAFKHTP
jgi:hypothetical protein